MKAEYIRIELPVLTPNILQQAPLPLVLYMRVRDSARTGRFMSWQIPATSIVPSNDAPKSGGLGADTTPKASPSPKKER